MKKIEHIGIAVKDLEASISFYQILLGTAPYKREMVPSEKVETVFFETESVKIELLGATAEDSVIHTFIKRRGEGIHHIAWAVDDIYKEIKRLKSEGYIFANETPKKGADNKLIVFLHPKSTHGTLMELCQDIS